MMYYFYVILGCLLYVGFQLNSAFTLPDFKWGYFYKTNIIPVCLNLVIGFILVSIRAELTNIYPITFLTAILLGLSGQVIFKKIQDAVDPEKQTYLGK
jgi:hypothetical protein